MGETLGSRPRGQHRRRTMPAVGARTRQAVGQMPTGSVPMQTGLAAADEPGLNAAA